MKSTFNLLRRLGRCTAGQDAIEYTLLLAFVVLASAAIFVNTGSGVKIIWGTGTQMLSTANTVAAGGSATAGTGNPGNGSGNNGNGTGTNGNGGGSNGNNGNGSGNNGNGSGNNGNGKGNN